MAERYQSMFDQAETAQAQEDLAPTDPIGSDAILLEPYESAYMSAFIYAIGYLDGAESAAKCGDGSRGMATLLVQSSQEVAFGDVVAGWNGRYFLFEFKRSEVELATEWDKSRRKQLLSGWRRGDDQQWRAAAKKGHYVAFGTLKKSPDLLFMAYSELLYIEHKENPRDQSTWPDKSLRTPLNPFLKWMRDKKEGTGWSAQELGEYLEWMARFDKGKKKVASPAERFTGILVKIKEDGRIVFFAFTGMEMLQRITLALCLKREQSTKLTQ